MQILTIPQRGNTMKKIRLWQKKEFKVSGKSTSSTPVALTSCLCLSTSGLTEAIEPLPRCSKVSICILFFYYTLVLGFSLSSSSLDLFSDSLIMGVTAKRKDISLLVHNRYKVFGCPWFVVEKNNNCFFFWRNHRISAECNVGRVGVRNIGSLCFSGGQVLLWLLFEEASGVTSAPPLLFSATDR